jgi:hypothetical protein
MRHAARALSLILLVSAAGSSFPPRPAISGAADSGGTVRLPSTASIWLSDASPQERNSSAGQFALVKIKTIQEMAAIRFDARPIRGRDVLSARLFLHKAGADMLRYLRVSTVSQDWAAGTSRQPYGAADGATYLWADAGATRPWSYPGSEFADVVMGMGHSITTYAERREEENDWISVPLTRELVYALATGHSDGLAVMDGGTPAFFNNFIHSAQAGDHAPYIEVEVGAPRVETPGPPRVTAEPAPARAHMTTGAIRIAIEPDPAVFRWNLEIDGRRVPRWQVPWPRAVVETGREQDQIRSGRTSRDGSVVFYLDDLQPGRSHTLSVVAVARSGAVSRPVHLSVSASPSLSDALPLGPLARPEGAATAITTRRFAVWPVPGLVKISPETGRSMFRDMAGDGRAAERNAVWNGRSVQLFGGRGEYVSYQIVIERVDPARPLTDVRVTPGDLTGPAGVIGGGDIELYKNWYARNGDGHWQPSYAIPWAPGRPIEIPDRQRALDGQTNQSLYVDVYIPKRAGAGTYAGAITVQAGADAATLPVELQVYDFELPDRLSFLPELNAYAVPANAIDFHRLAHQHRLVFNPWVVQPVIEGAGGNIEVGWDEYDAAVGPLLSGEAFAHNRRPGVPTPVMYLPFIDSWPTVLTPETYRYDGPWPGKGDPRESLVDHYMTAPYIGDGLSQRYKDAFLAVQRQFVAHFEERGWNQTEMQLFFGGKNTHRVDFGSNIWWTTDEPYHWDDWIALQFFCNLWAQGRKALGADPAVWPARADLSRPMWTGRVLDTIVDRVYWGGFADARSHQRAAWLSEHAGMRPRVYGAANPATESNTQSVSTLLQVWLHGADGFLPWQTLGNDGSLDRNDNVDGSTLLVPGTRFGLPVVGDMRLKAFRDGQQLIEYLVILADRHQLEREQVRAMLEKVVAVTAARRDGAPLDDAGATRFSALETWQIAALRRQVAELIAGTRSAR